jgi:hypothetical protein
MHFWYVPTFCWLSSSVSCCDTPPLWFASHCRYLLAKTECSSKQRSYGNYSVSEISTADEHRCCTELPFSHIPSFKPKPIIFDACLEESRSTNKLKPFLLLNSHQMAMLTSQNRSLNFEYSLANKLLTWYFVEARLPATGTVFDKSSIRFLYGAMNNLLLTCLQLLGDFTQIIYWVSLGTSLQGLTTRPLPQVKLHTTSDSRIKYCTVFSPSR